MSTRTQAHEHERQQRRERLDRHEELEQRALELLRDFATAPEQLAHWMAEADAAGQLSAADAERLLAELARVGGPSLVAGLRPGGLARRSSGGLVIHDADVARAAKTEQTAHGLASKLGLSLSGLAIHVDDAGHEHAAAVGARGVMEEGAVYLNPATYDPNTTSGQRLLGHEVAHLAQRALGASVGSTTASPMMAEVEASQIASRYVAGQDLGPVTVPLGAFAQAAEPTTAPAVGTEALLDETKLQKARAFYTKNVSLWPPAQFQRVSAALVIATKTSADDEFLQAVARFQSSHSLTADGMAGKGTLYAVFSGAAMNRAYTIADTITSQYEGGGYASIQTKDVGVVSYGKHQATLSSGNLTKLVELYLQKAKAIQPVSQNATTLEGYLPKMKGTAAEKEALRSDSAFTGALVAAASEEAMQQAQDEYFKEDFWKPAVQMALQYGITSQLGWATVYDCFIQGGAETCLGRTQTELGGIVGASVPRDGQQHVITEQEFLTTFNAKREGRLEDIAKKRDSEGKTADAKMLRSSKVRPQAFSELATAGNLTMNSNVAGQNKLEIGTYGGKRTQVDTPAQVTAGTTGGTSGSPSTPGASPAGTTAPPAVVAPASETARDVLHRFASYIPMTSQYVNLDETGLGAYLASSGSTGQADKMNAIFDGLYGTDRDDVAYATAVALSDAQLRSVPAPVLERLMRELSGGLETPSESQQKARIEAVLGTSTSVPGAVGTAPADAEKQLVKTLYQTGTTNADALTDAVFYHRHPERVQNGQRQPIGAGDTALVTEWRTIKSSVVQPALTEMRQGTSGGTTPTTGGSTTTPAPAAGGGTSTPVAGPTGDVRRCNNGQAILRDETGKAVDPPRMVPNGVYVRVLETRMVNNKALVRVSQLASADATSGTELGWTNASNLVALVRPARPSSAATQMAALLAQAQSDHGDMGGACYRFVKHYIKDCGGYGDILDIYQDERFEGYQVSAKHFHSAVQAHGAAAMGLEQVSGLPMDAPAGTLLITIGNGQINLSTVHGDIAVIEGVKDGVVVCYNDGRMKLSADRDAWTSGKYQGVLLGMYKPVARSAVQAKGELRGDDPQHTAAQGVSGSGSALPYLGAIQTAFGTHDVSTIRATVGGAAAEACEDLGAQAYATGESVAFKDAPSLHVAAHEAAHVVQQRAGVSLYGGVGKSGDVYEQHADAVADAVVRGDSAEGLLSQMAGPMPSAAAPGAVQKLDEAGWDRQILRNAERAAQQQQQERARQAQLQAAIAGVAPTTLSTIDDFVRLVQRFEQAYPQCATDWQLCATMLRKLTAYNTSQWNQLVADRADTSRPWVPPMNAADYVALDGRSGILLPTPGGNIDVTHVLTGIDSMNFPHVGVAMQAAAVAMSGTTLEGPMAATWSGDVGSALAGFGTHNRSDLTTRDDYYNSFASSDDMLGDIDGIALGGVPNVAPNAPLSQRLSAYYGQGASATGAGTVERRFAAFCTRHGFTVTGSGTARTLDSATRTRIRDQINSFAWLFCVNIDRTYAVRPRPYSPADLDWFTTHFVNWVEAGLRREP